jgi:integrase
MAHIQRRNGRYQARFRDLTGAERTKTFDRKVDAERFLATTEADKARGAWVDPRLGRITFGEWASHVEATRTNRRPATKVRDESLLRNHILPRFGEMPLRSIQPADVREWIADMDTSRLAPTTIAKVYQVLHRAFAVALTDDRIGQTPCRAVVLPSTRSAERRYLTAQEVNELAAVIDPRFTALVLTASYTGARFGELAALRVKHFDPLRRTLRIEQTLTEVSGHVAFGPTKTRASRRKVTVPRFLVEEIVRHMRAFPDPSQLVFTSPEGGPLRRTNFRRRFWLPAVESSVGLPCTFHDLRHGNAAFLVAEGAHPKVIQERLGHGSIRVTLDTYGHLFDGLDEAAADALDGLFNRSEQHGRAGTTVAELEAAKGA